VRFATIGSIAVFGALAALVAALEIGEHKKIESAIGCKQELVLIDYWKSVRLIWEVRPREGGFDVLVNEGTFAEMPRKLQLQIGKAAWCPVALAARGGMVRIVDLNDNEIARVADGKWSSRQFPE
jgi:hypothetical protein